MRTELKQCLLKVYVAEFFLSEIVWLNRLVSVLASRNKVVKLGELFSNFDFVN